MQCIDEVMSSMKRNGLFYLFHWVKSNYAEICPEGIQPCHMKNRDIYDIY